MRCSYAAADRSAWYHCNPDYLAYLKRVVAYVDGGYGTRAHADERVLAGTSAGGKATAYVSFELPGIFGNVGLLSPSVSPPPVCFEPYLSGRKRTIRTFACGWEPARTNGAFIVRQKRWPDSSEVLGFRSKRASCIRDTASVRGARMPLTCSATSFTNPDVKSL